MSITYKIILYLSTFHDNEDTVKEIEKGKLKRENVGSAFAMPTARQDGGIYRKEELAK